MKYLTTLFLLACVPLLTVQADPAPPTPAAPAAPAATTAAPAPTPLPIALVQALNKLSGGPHAGYRANHAKGVLVAGTFTPAPGAAAFSKAVHFSRAVPVLVRFSDATGVPTLPDADPNASPHGMAIRFQLPGGATTDIVSISVNAFPVATPEDFLAFLTAAAASGPGVSKPTPIEQFLASHPAALKFVSIPKPAPVSFATLAFYGVDAFKFTNRHGDVHYARYQILPVAGEQALPDTLAATIAPDYLMEEIQRRVATAPVAFDLVAQVAADGDVTDDPTVVWSADHRIVKLGTLTLNKVPAEQQQAQKLIMFDPLSLLDGIAPSADPVLLARPSAYGVSYSQRIH
jgi:catalase